MGLKEILKNTDVTNGNAYDKKKPNKFIIWALVAALAFLALSSFSSGENKEGEKADKINNSNYQEEQEQRLAKTLKKIDRAGDVTVCIKYDDEGEVVTAKDEKSVSENNEDDGGKSNRFESETTVVMSGKGSEEPYIVKKRTPEPSGVLVIASGAADESVRLKIYEAVLALYGISPHRIKVTY